VFLLVPAQLGSLRQRAVKWLLCVCVGIICSCVKLNSFQECQDKVHVALCGKCYIFYYSKHFYNSKLMLNENTLTSNLGFVLLFLFYIFMLYFCN